MIFQLIYTFFFISIMLIQSVQANISEAIELNNYFSKMSNLYAHFIQRINDSDGKIIEENQGELWIKRPNFFHWHMQSPEENFLISDGKTLWFYIPSINQVTAYWLQDLSENIFITFFVNDSLLKWNNYNIFKKKDFFSLVPKYKDTNIKECRIVITDDGIINMFSIIEETGQSIDYYLSNQNNHVIDLKKFHFILSQDMQLDEQRK